MKLYFSPGTVSLVCHVVLRELALDFTLVPTPTGEEAHLAADYRALNPMARVPALVTDHGVLTEVVSILRWLAAQHPERKLLPSDPWMRAKCDELLLRLATRVQPAFRMIVRADRVVGASSSSDTLDAVRRAGRASFIDALDHVESSLSPSSSPADMWAMGDQMSIADPYLAVFWLWARFAKMELERWPKLGRIALALWSRPAAQSALRAEGLVDAEGRPTPPARV